MANRSRGDGGRKDSLEVQDPPSKDSLVLSLSFSPLFLFLSTISSSAQERATVSMCPSFSIEASLPIISCNCSKSFALSLPLYALRTVLTAAAVVTSAPESCIPISLLSDSFTSEWGAIGDIGKDMFDSDFLVVDAMGSLLSAVRKLLSPVPSSSSSAVGETSSSSSEEIRSTTPP